MTLCRANGAWRAQLRTRHRILTNQHLSQASSMSSNVICGICSCCHLNRSLNLACHRSLGDNTILQGGITIVYTSDQSATCTNASNSSNESFFKQVRLTAWQPRARREPPGSHNIAVSMDLHTASRKCKVLVKHFMRRKVLDWPGQLT